MHALIVKQHTYVMVFVVVNVSQHMKGRTPTVGAVQRGVRSQRAHRRGHHRLTPSCAEVCGPAASLGARELNRPHAGRGLHAWEREGRGERVRRAGLQHSAKRRWPGRARGPPAGPGGREGSATRLLYTARPHVLSASCTVLSSSTMAEEGCAPGPWSEALMQTMHLVGVLKNQTKRPFLSLVVVGVCRFALWRRCRRETRERRRGKGRREEGGEKKGEGKKEEKWMFLSFPATFLGLHLGHKNSSTKLHFREPPTLLLLHYSSRGPNNFSQGAKPPDPPGWDPNQRSGFAPPKTQTSASSGVDGSHSQEGRDCPAAAVQHAPALGARGRRRPHRPPRPHRLAHIHPKATPNMSMSMRVGTLWEPSSPAARARVPQNTAVGVPRRSYAGSAFPSSRGDAAGIFPSCSSRG